MIAKQERYKKEFDKFNLNYESQFLNLPKGKVENESFLEFRDEKIEEQNEDMGTDLQEISNILFNRCRNIFEFEGQVLEYN